MDKVDECGAGLGLAWQSYYILYITRRKMTGLGVRGWPDRNLVSLGHPITGGDSLFHVKNRFHRWTFGSDMCLHRQRGLSITPSLSQKRYINNNGHFSLLTTLQILFVLLWIFLWPCPSKWHLSCDCSFRRFCPPPSKANSESYLTIAED